MSARSFIALLVLLCSNGCGRERITYDDVAPILARRCVGCHSDSGLAARPRLDRYDDIVRQREQIGRAVWTREMPPWIADDTGICCRWRDSLWLPKDELSTLVAWLEDGAPAAKRTAPASLPARASPTLAHVDVTLDQAEDFVPGLTDRAYRCFVVDPKLERDRFMTALRVSSTDPRAVAQVTLFAIESEPPGKAYPCYGSPLVRPARLIASWTWDVPVLRLPPGTGVRLRKGEKLVMQVHYDVITSGLAAPTRTSVELELEDGVKEAVLLRLASEPFVLQPSRRVTRTGGDLVVPRKMTLWGIAPRMHTLGKSLRVQRVEGAASRCLGAFERWDFYRQRLFLYQEPVRLAEGDRLRVLCTYDTESRQDVVTSGGGIRDEECAAYLYVTEE